MSDLTEPCPQCGTMLRWETSHERCDGCGWIRPCCEGAALPPRQGDNNNVPDASTHSAKGAAPMSPGATQVFPSRMVE